ncbi:MAG: adenylate/guanylate cyclase domain-containing protein [Alphaproteobacteria bacterium]|nr:adenylate/guanylate cyclase domain-containing protein [Alphaproteobacteria bacterium]
MLKSLLVNRGVHIILLLALLVGFLSMRIEDYTWVKGLRYWAFDSYNRYYPRESNNQVVIVDIDEVSLQDNKMGQWPWPRTDVARLVVKLKDLGAKAIVFDMVFAEEDRTSPTVLLKKMPKENLNTQIETALNSMPDHDAVLANTFKQVGNVVTGFVWSTSYTATRHLPTISRPILLSKEMKDFYQGLYDPPGVITNLVDLEKSAEGNGSFGQMSDDDGTVRSVPLLFVVSDQQGRPHIYPSLTLEALRVAEDPKNPHKIRSLKESELTYLSYPYLLGRGKYSIPMGRDARFYIHYSPLDMSKFIPAYKIYEGLVQPDQIKDKIVLIGTSSVGLKDIRSTPLSIETPGVDVHRNMIEQIMSGRFLSRPDFMKSVEIIFAAIVALAAIALSPFVNALLLGLVVILLAIIVSFSSFWAYENQGILIDPVYPSLTILVIYFLSSILTYIRTELERRRVRRAFGLYISPEYMHELTKNPKSLSLGGEIRDVTVMFTDIRGFTSISEKMEPNELIQVMNDFLTPMSEQVMLYRGTIDKYMGDAMMTFWNAPLFDPEHERSACLAALSMKKALIPVNAMLEEKAKAQGRPFLMLRAGVGVNSGPAAVGNMGSRQRFAYSVLGDTVNLASRLEGQTKTYGVDIIIGEETAKKIPEFSVLELDIIKVKGKDKQVRIFTILSATRTKEFNHLEQMHKDMLGAYRREKWDRALSILNQINLITPDELKKYYIMMIERITDFQINNPDPQWSGVHIATEK